MKMRQRTKFENSAIPRPQSNPEVETRSRCRAINVEPFHQTGLLKKDHFFRNPPCRQSATGLSHKAAIGGIESRRRALSIPHSRNLQLARGLISQMRKHGLFCATVFPAQLVPLQLTVNGLGRVRVRCTRTNSFFLKSYHLRCFFCSRSVSHPAPCSPCRR